MVTANGSLARKEYDNCTFLEIYCIRKKMIDERRVMIERGKQKIRKCANKQKGNAA